jgi:signal transduction histidine kinase/DNA-binding response OmpR family regulator
MKDNFALLSKSDYPNINVNEILYQRVGLINNTAHKELFESWFPNHSSTISYDNIDQAFLSLSKGETDVMMGSQGQLLMLTNYLEYVGYKMNLMFDRSYDSVFGFNNDETLLCAVIDKALRLIDTDGISGQWMRKTYDYREKLAQSRLPLLIGASALLLCVLTLVYVMFRRKQHEGKRMQKQIKSRTAQLDRQRDLMFVATSAAATLLETDAEEYFDAMYRGMEMIGESVDIDRVSVWQNFRFDDGHLYYKLICQWANKGLPELDHSTYFSYDEMLPNWAPLFNRGESVNAVIDDLTSVEHYHLTKFGIKSILAVPVFLKRKLWGFVSFDDYQRKRRFPDVEQYVLRSWGLIAVGAIQRSESAKGMRLALTKLKAVMSNYKGIIWSIDRDGVITTFNGQYLEKLEMQPSFLEGKNLEAARRKNRHLDVIDNVDKTYKFGPQDWISEIDGRLFHSYTTPMFDDEGNATGVVGSTDDVTDSIQLQRDLETAVEAAQAANRAKSAFLANMSHEIRTPMNAIIGMITIGKNAEDLSRKDYCFSKIEDASKHLLGVINDILDMSKIEANKFELSPTEFNFEKMLQQVVNVVNFRVDEKQQILKVHIDSEIPRVLIGDRQRLAQVITNLLGNAVKFTSERGTISLDTRFLGETNDNLPPADGNTCEGGGDGTSVGDCAGDVGTGAGAGDDATCTLEISVSDSGIGISPEQQAKLFQSFQQAESSTTRRFGGTGLGLSISKSIIEMMGGRIWVESELGSGAKFLFTVNVKRGCEKTAETSVRNTNWGDVRILVVDDDPDILSYFDGIIRGFGSTCDMAESAQEALSLIQQYGAYDVYFIDWKMPLMDGIELTGIVKRGSLATGDGGAHNVVLMSAADWSSIEEDAKLAGVDKFLPKPLFPSAIADVINECLYATQKPEEIEPDISGLFAGHCILLAEDVEINREIVLALLEPTQLEIDCAENGAEAVRMYAEAQGKYEMIFMDVQMPEMDGYEATQRIRAIDASNAKTVPIIAMTANVFKEDVERCMEAGMNSHIGKPLDFEEVLNKLQTYLL